MTLSTSSPEQVAQLKFDELQPGDTVEVTGMTFNVKGKPTDVILGITVFMTDEVACNNDHPFRHITKLWGVGIASSNHKLLTSRPAHETNWVGNDTAVGKRWQAGTCGGGRAILVTAITVIRN